MKRSACAALLAATLATPCWVAADEVQFNDKGELLRPAGYREWAFLSSGLGMNYGPSRPRPGQQPNFTNVFVNPAALKAFNQTGQWPDGTQFMLEVRQSVENASINEGGRSQGDLIVVESEVKDSRRYPDGGWAYFNFGRAAQLQASVSPLPRTESCYTCHSQHGAVQWTFTQFYPQQFEVATKLATVRKDYDPAKKLE